MATALQGDDPDVRHTAMHAMAREVARRRLAQPRPVSGGKPKRLAVTYSLSNAMPKGMKP